MNNNVNENINGIPNNMSVVNSQVSNNMVKMPIIVNGMDISNLPVSEFTEEMANAMTDEQVNQYIANFTDEEMEIFREVYGYGIVDEPLTDEELARRSAKRASLMSNFGGTSANKGEEVVEEVKATKTEQTGNVIFGVRK